MKAMAVEGVNYWPASACARAFWGQQELPPYRRLLADTMDWITPQSGDRWLDLGCGCGQLTEALWVKSGGRVAEIVGLDCAADNAVAFERLRARVATAAFENRIHFLHANFSGGLATLDNEHFQGIVSGLAVHYAESYSTSDGRWTTDAYDQLLKELHRVLRQGGSLVFSVHVPKPDWGKVAFQSVVGVFRARNPFAYLLNALRMWRYGVWLKREAHRGRFHYLPVATVVRKLAEAGFESIEHRLSYAGQAYIFRCRKAA